MKRLMILVTMTAITVFAKAEGVGKTGAERLATLKMPDDQAALVELAKSDECLQVRLSAMSVLGDPVVLAEFEKRVYATGDAFWDRKGEPVDDEPKDQAQLSQVARTDKDKGVRIAAVKKLVDQSVLADVAKSDKDWLVRLFAIWELEDQALLAELSEKDDDILIRKEAEKRLAAERLRPTNLPPGLVLPGTRRQTKEMLERLAEVTAAEAKRKEQNKQENEK